MQACYEGDHNGLVGCMAEILGEVSSIDFFCHVVGMVVDILRRMNRDEEAEIGRALVIVHEVKVSASNVEASSVAICHVEGVIYHD